MLFTSVSQAGSLALYLLSHLHYNYNKLINMFCCW